MGLFLTLSQLEGTPGKLLAKGDHGHGGGDKETPFPSAGLYLFSSFPELCMAQVGEEHRAWKPGVGVPRTAPQVAPRCSRLGPAAKLVRATQTHHATRWAVTCLGTWTRAN